MPARDNVLQFEADLAAFSKQVDVQFALVVKAVVFALFRKIVLRTPVDTGRAAGSWTVSAGEPGADMLPPGDYGTPTADQIMAKLGSVSFDPPEGVYWIYNNLPYIEVLEYGLYPSAGKNVRSPTGKTIGGFSVQAPQGMVRVSLAEVEADVYSGGLDVRAAGA